MRLTTYFQMTGNTYDKVSNFPTYYFIVICYLLIISCSSCTAGNTDEHDNSSQQETYTDKVEYYNFSNRIPESLIYAVKAAGEYIKVLPTHEPHLAWIGVDEGTVLFEISLQSGKIEKAEVRPLGKNYKWEIKDGHLFIGLKKYDRVSVEINDDLENPLFIFANPIDKSRPDKTSSSIKYFEAGKVYDEGNIVLNENCKEVYIEPGAYVKGNILGVDVDGVKIHGGGLIDASDYPGRYSEFYQPFGIALNRCENSEVSDITQIFASGGWCSLYSNCHNSSVTNVKTLGLNSAPGVKTNNDSMDIIGGRNMHISKCFMRGHDDVYCLKSQKFKLKGDIVDGIWYDDCIGWNIDAGNTFEIGYETQIDISNVHYKDIYAIHSGTSGTDMRRAALSIHNGAAGTISNVTYENAYIEDAMEFAIYLACLKHSYNIGYDDKGNELQYSPGKIKGICYKGVNLLNARRGKGLCVVQGYNSEYNVSDVTFTDFNYLGRKITSIDDGIWNIKTNYSDFEFN